MITHLKFPVYLALTLACSQAFAVGQAGTYQFAARLFSDGLGRAPDKTEWTNITDPINRYTCDANMAKSLAKGVLKSSEFTTNTGNDNYDRVMRLYRATLYRDPDSGGLAYWAGTIAPTYGWNAVVDNFLETSAFANMISSAICNQTAKGEAVIGMDKISEPIRVVNAGGGDYGGSSRAELQNLLNAKSAAYLANPKNGPITVTLSPGTLINLTDSQPLTVGPGVILTTLGNPSPQNYPRMARITRKSTMNGPLVILKDSSTLSNIWVDGSRSTYFPKQDNMTYDPATEQNNIQVRGTHVSVTSNFITDPAAFSALYFSSNAGPCNAGWVAGNLITLYGSGHYPNQMRAFWSDGISIACSDVTVTKNSVIDATDVGIILFRNPAADPNTGVASIPGPAQNSVVKDNIVINAGNSAYGALAMDGQDKCQKLPVEPVVTPPRLAPTVKEIAHAVQCTDGTTLNNNQAAFTNAIFDSNQIFGTPQTHIDVLMAVGTRAWQGRKSVTGKGGTFSNNSTVGGPIHVTAGIMVAGMRKATVTNNLLNVDAIQTVNCASAVALQAQTYDDPVNNFKFDSSSGLDSGDIMHANQNKGATINFVMGSIDAACVGHP